MFALGHKQTLALVFGMSALPPKADILCVGVDPGGVVRHGETTRRERPSERTQTRCALNHSQPRCPLRVPLGLGRRVPAIKVQEKRAGCQPCDTCGRERRAICYLRLRRVTRWSAIGRCMPAAGRGQTPMRCA